ncbi:MAG: fimbrial assembly protein [Rhizobacter sp.]|nr:fimbrial assembly protein [Rhizobacter sp.]
MLAVLAIAVTSGIPSLSDLLRRRTLDGTAAELAADLRFARSEALRLHEATRMSFYARADGDCYVVHTGGENACPCGSSSATVCVGDALALKTVRSAAPNGPSLRANVASMLFDPRNGTNAQAGTIALVDASGRAVHQVVNVLGRVRSCSPQGAVPGYSAC